MSFIHTVLETFSGALQGTISVLITCFAGYVVARRGWLNRLTVKHISKLCTSLFLPCLLIQQMGPELTVSSLSRYWVIPIWGLTTTILAHLIGWAGQRLFGLKHWTIVACGRPNSNALPLLLLRSLETTGVLKRLSRNGEDPKDTLSRAQSLCLLNAIVQQVLTLQTAPSILKLDDGRGKHNAHTGGYGTLKPGPGRIHPITQDEEHVGLLNDVDGDGDEEFSGRGALAPMVDVPDTHWPECIRFAQRPLSKLWGFMSAPLIGAIIALILGMVPPLHRTFLDEGSVMYALVTQSIKNLGDLFVVLQTFSVGAELGLVPSSPPGYVQTIWVLSIRFLAMPVISTLFVYATAGHGWYVSDPLVWFLLILLPTGPSAMLLMSVAELVDIDQGPIAGYLTTAYLLSPVMAVVCSIGLTVVDAKS